MESFDFMVYTISAIAPAIFYKKICCVFIAVKRSFFFLMPIGVPKVPYRLPGEEDASYVDIYNLLYRERILFLAQAVDDDISNLAN